MNKKQKAKFAHLLAESGVKETGVSKIMDMVEEAMKPEPKAPRVAKPKHVMSLQEWETRQGKRLDARQMITWIDEKNYDIGVMVYLVEEFRTDMISKAKPYANFIAAFQNYFNKGYLSIKPDNPRVKRASATTLDRRGFSL
jgi:hypothetical protein